MPWERENYLNPFEIFNKIQKVICSNEYILIGNRLDKKNFEWYLEDASESIDIGIKYKVFIKNNYELS